MRVVFLGTPEFGVPSLHSLARTFDVVGVVTQPDRPAGRGRQPRAPAVKKAALGLGLPVQQPERIRSEPARDVLQDWLPDVIVVAAFGQILPASVLALPPLGCVNLHASLLPRWRGASPIQAALLHGDDETGVTLMLMDEGLDTGPLLTQRPVPIRLDHTAGTLSAELAELGADLLVESLPRYAAGGITPRPQNAADATSAPRLSRADGRLDPSRSADDLQRQLRAYTPWPGTFLRLGEVELAVLAAHTEPGPVDRPPGTLTERGGLPMLATASGWLALERVQVPGRTVVDGASFLNGHRHLLGAASG